MKALFQDGNIGILWKDVKRFDFSARVCGELELVKLSRYCRDGLESEEIKISNALYGPTLRTLDILIITDSYYSSRQKS